MRFLCRHEQVGVLMLIMRQMLSGNSSQISAVCGKVNLEIIFSDRFSVEPFQAETAIQLLYIQGCISFRRSICTTLLLRMLNIS